MTPAIDALFHEPHPVTPQESLIEQGARDQASLLCTPCRTPDLAHARFGAPVCKDWRPDPGVCIDPKAAEARLDVQLVGRPATQ